MVYSARSWTRGVAAKHAALSRPRSRVRIPSGPPEAILNRQPGQMKIDQAAWLIGTIAPARRTNDPGLIKGRNRKISAGEIGSRSPRKNQTNRTMIRTHYFVMD